MKRCLLRQIKKIAFVILTLLIAASVMALKHGDRDSSVRCKHIHSHAVVKMNKYYAQPNIPEYGSAREQRNLRGITFMQ
jgi:hypothetical protein